MVKTYLPPRKGQAGQSSPIQSPAQSPAQSTGQASQAQNPAQAQQTKRAGQKNQTRTSQPAKKTGGFGRFLRYVVGVGIVGAALAYGVNEAYKKGIERVLTNDLNQSRQQLANTSSARVYRATMNNDAIEDLVIFDESERGTVYIGMADGSYKRFEDVQADEKRGFETAQKAEQERVKKEVGRTARKYGVRAR